MPGRRLAYVLDRCASVDQATRFQSSYGPTSAWDQRSSQRSIARISFAKAIRKDTTCAHIQRALFRIWDYQDEAKKRSLRWDPMEDRRYALRWWNPDRSSVAQGKGTMLAANSLAIEALRWFPTMVASGQQAQTTGFQRIGQKELYFVWPIWTPPIGMDAWRSLLASPDLGEIPLPRMSLARQGIAEVYRSQRIRQNQYYCNFAPAQPAG